MTRLQRILKKRPLKAEGRCNIWRGGCRQYRTPDDARRAADRLGVRMIFGHHWVLVRNGSRWQARWSQWYFLDWLAGDT